MIFMGQRFLEWGRGRIRNTDWSKADRFSGIRALYRDLIHLRRKLVRHTRGLRQHEFARASCQRRGQGHRVSPLGRRRAADDVVVIANFADRAYGSYRIGLPRAGLWRVRFNSRLVRLQPGVHNQASSISKPVAMAPIPCRAAGRSGWSLYGGGAVTGFVRR